MKRPNRTTWIFRNWYPLLYVGSCYKEMAILIPRHPATPMPTTGWPIWISGSGTPIPRVWLERIHSPVLTEYLQVVYTLFVPAVLLVAFLLVEKRRFTEFQYYAFLIALGFLVSYIGYLLVPARGPRFLLKTFATHTVTGFVAVSAACSTALDRLESAHYDCFPSGHTELTILAWWGSRMVSKRLFQVYFAYTPSIIFATVYLRYHYTVDLLAGAFAALVLIVAAPVALPKLSTGRGVSIGRN